MQVPGLHDVITSLSCSQKCTALRDLAHMLQMILSKHMNFNCRL